MKTATLQSRRYHMRDLRSSDTRPLIPNITYIFNSIIYFCRIQGEILDRKGKGLPSEKKTIHFQSIFHEEWRNLLRQRLWQAGFQNLHLNFLRGARRQKLVALLYFFTLSLHIHGKYAESSSSVTII